MKKIKIAFSALVVSSMLLTTSCNDEYLNTTPTDAIQSSTIYGTAEGLMTSVNGITRTMYTRQNSSQGQNGYTAQMIIADVMGEDVVFPSTGNNYFIQELRWLSQENANSATVSYPWTFWSQIIKNSNAIIKYGPEATGDIALKENALAQAYAYRAFGYFQIAQLYGKRYVKGGDNSGLGAIIRLDPNDISPKGRSTVEETYAQIWADLAKAEQYIVSSGKKKIDNSHFALDNILGLKARIALVQQDYEKAANYASLARAGKKLMSKAEYLQGFNDYTNPEWMWGITIQADQSDFFGNFMAYMSRNYNSTQIRQAPKVMNKVLFDAFPSTDVRTQVVKPDGKHNLGLKDSYTLFDYTSEKFLTANRNNDVSLGDVVFMRASEMYLIEAEAKFQLGNEAGSKAVLTELVSARNPNFAGFTTSGEQYLKEILLNRRIELWGEGFRFFDLKRLNQVLDRNGTNAVASVAETFKVEAGSNKWQWKIPQAEINSNPLAEQNPS